MPDGHVTPDRVANWRGRRVNPDRQEIVKLLPDSPPDKGDIVLVDGERCIVTYSHVRWDGPRWTIRELRVKAARS